MLNASGEFFTNFDPTLDPSDIFWPNGWVSRPITFSSNHASSTGVTMTLSFTSQSLIPKESWVSVTIGGFSSVLYTEITANFPAYTDNSLQFSGLTLPSTAGAYGPVSVHIWQSTTAGQLIASSSSFGFVGIVSAVPAFLESLSISYASGASEEVSKVTSLVFSFPLTANLHHYDFFVLSAPVLYSFSSLSASMWSSSASGYDLFNTTGFDFSAAARTLTIYGIQQDFSQDVTVTFTVAGFVNPAYVITGSSATWTVAVYRFGTATIIQQFKGTGPSTTVAGTVTVNSWLPSNGYITASQIISGTVTYMTLQFSCQHLVPAAGTIVITFSNAVSLTNGYLTAGPTQPLGGATGTYGMVLPSTSLSISVQAQIVTLTVGSTSLGAGTVITVYTLTGFYSASPSISSIISMTGTNTIDSGLNLYTITLAASTAVAATAAEPSIYFTSTLAISASYTCGPLATGGLIVDFLLDGPLAPGQTLSISMPILNQATAADNAVAFGTSVWGQYVTAIASSAATTYASGCTTLTTAPTVSLNTVTITLSGTYLTNNHVSVILGTGASAGTLAGIYMPNFPTSIYSRHELALKFTVAGTSVLRLYTKPLTFAAITAVAAVLEPFCIDTGLPGMLAQISITPPYAYTPSAGYTSYIDFKIVSTDITLSAGLGSGLTSGSTYPSSGASLTLSYTSAETAAYTSHLILTQSGFAASAISFTFPFPSLTAATSYTLTCSIVGQYSDGSQHYLTHNTAASNAFVAPVTNTSPISFGSTSRFSQTAVYLLTFAFASVEGITSSGAFGISFDPGFSVASPVLVETSTVAATVYSSSNAAFRYLTLHVGSPVTNTAYMWTLMGLTTSWISGILNAYTYGFYSATGYSTTATPCDLNGVLPFYISALILNYIPSSYSPITTNGIGADAFTTTLTVSFTTPGVLYGLPGTSFSVSVGSNFETEGATWIITVGSYTQSGTCFYSNTFTATGFTSDMPTGTAIVITVTGVPLPAISTAGTAYYGFDSVFALYNDYYVFSWIASVDDSVPGSIETQTSFALGSSFGSSNISLVSIFPNCLGAIGVYSQIKFKPSYALPAGTVLTISGGVPFLADSSIATNLWCNYGFTTASIINSYLVLTLNYAVPLGASVEVRKDGAFSISYQSPSPSPAFLISAVYGTTTVIADSVSAATSASKLVFNPAPAAFVNSASLEFNQTNMGVATTTSLTFSLSAATSSDYYFCFDVDGSYDAHFSNFFTFTEAPSVYYITAATSLVTNPLLCVVDHWVITCPCFAVVAPATDISFSFPSRNTAASSITWHLYVVDSNRVPVVAPYYGIAKKFTSIPSNNVDLYYVSHDPAAAETYTLTITALINETYSSGAAIYVYFPREFLLSVDNPGSIDCVALYNTTTPNYFVNSGSQCSVDKNIVEFLVPASTVLTSSYWTVFTLNKVWAPPSGALRGISTGYDAVKTEQFDVYSYWTGNFYVMTTKSSTASAFSSMSTLNLDAAYTGFMSPDWRNIAINRGQNILVAPGTYSAPILISAVGGLGAASVFLSASDVSDRVLEFDAATYYLYNNSPEDYLKVGVPSRTVTGYYYITWNITENPLVSGRYLYKAPSKTSVEVYQANAIPITIGYISNVPVRGVGFPIPLSISGGISPFSDVSITFSGYKTVSFYPSTFTFASMSTSGSFIIGISQASTSSSLSFTMVLSGTDSDAFSIQSQAFFYTGPVSPSPPHVTALFVNVTSQSAAVSIGLQTTSLVTWAFGSSFLFSSNPALSSFNTTMLTAYPLYTNATSSQVLLATQVQAYLQDLDSIVPGTDWKEYSTVLLLVACTTYFTSQDLVSSGTSLLYNFTSLIPQSNYTAIAWADNYSGMPMAFLNTSATTLAVPEPCRLTLTFNDTIGNSRIGLINMAIAETLNIYSARVTNFTGLSRRRATSSVTSVVVADLRSTVAPSTLCASLAAQNAALLSNIVANDVAVSSVTSSYTAAKTTEYPAAEFENITITAEDSVVFFNFTATVDGYVCCIGEKDPNFNFTLTSFEVFLGVDREMNTPAFAYCWNVTAKENYSEVFNFTAIDSMIDGGYYFTCTDCNSYPVIPQCIDDSKLVYAVFIWDNNSFNFAQVITASLIILAHYF